MALVISTWLWGSKYGPEYVDRLRAGVARNLKREYRFAVFHPGPEDDRLTKIPGCFCRLRMFDPAWQELNGIWPDDRLVCVDLDTVIIGPLDPLFDRPEPFVILQGGNYSNPCPYGGALMMLRAGAHTEVWSEFTLEKAQQAPFHEFPDDQGWLWHAVPNAPGWKCGSSSGVYVFRKPGWPVNDALPSDARLVTFNGWRNPGKFQHLNWVRQNWK